jgi:hypothetical protein
MYLPLFKPVTPQKMLLGRKNIGQAFLPSPPALHPLQAMPMVIYVPYNIEA